MIITLHFRCYFVHTAIVDEGDDVVGIGGVARAVDDVGGGAVAVTYGKRVPFGGNARIDSELIALLTEA